MKKQDKAQKVLKKEKTNKKTKNIKARTKKFHLGILPYILLLCIFASVIIKIRDTRLVETSAQAYIPDSLKLIEKDEWNNLSKNTEKIKNEKSLLIYDEKNENSVNTYKNVSYVLDTMGVEVIPVKVNEQNKYSNLSKYDTMIVCLETLQDLYYSNSRLENWVEDGKGIFFTLPLQNDEALKRYADLLGIANTNSISTTEYHNMTFTDDFLVLAKGQTFNEDTINGYGLKVELKDDVTIHAEEAEESGNPIIWNVPYGNGFVTVCNAYMLQDKVARGIIAAGYSELHNIFAYPVINSSMYCIDDMPAPIPIGYNEIINEQYHCNMEDFYFNIWWPKMKSLTEKYGIKYSGFVIQTYEDSTTPPYNNTSYMETSKFYANAILSAGGEIGIHGYNHQSLALEGFNYRDDQIDYNPWNSLDDMWASIREVISYSKQLAPNAKIVSYVAPSNIISSYVWEEMKKNIPEIKVYAGVYIGNESEMVEEFEAKDDGIVYVPRTDSGMDITIGMQSDFLLYNELSYHYVHSNFFHPDDVIDESRGAGQGFETLFSKYENMIKLVSSAGLRNTTVAEGGAAVQRYCLTSCEQNFDDGTLTLSVNGIKDEVYYFVRLNNGENIKNIEGAEYQKINDNYYLLKISQKDVVIEME